MDYLENKISPSQEVRQIDTKPKPSPTLSIYDEKSI